MERVLIQIGSNVGNDSVQDLLTRTEHAYFVWLVEPNPYAMNDLKKNYNELAKKHRIAFIESAISPTEPTTDLIEMYTLSNDKASAYTSMNNEFASKHIPDVVLDTIKVKCVSINNLLKNINKNEIDFLFIDTEGYDIDIVDTINLNLYDIKNLIFEYIHSDGVLSFGGNKLNKLLDKLITNGYKVFAKEFNIIANK